MKRRTAMVMGALVAVLGGGLFALRLAGSPRPSQRPPVASDPASAQIAPPAAKSPRARPAAPAEDATSGVIDGRVINGMTHEGVPDAELTLVGDGGVSTFRTSSDGTFELAPAATGSFALASITAPGFLPYSPPVGVSAVRLTLTPGRAIHGVTLLLYPAVDYEGIVVDARGAPIAGVRVRWLGPPGEPVLESLPEWKSGSDGRFTFQAGDGDVLEASRGALRGWARIDRSVAIMKKLTIRLGHAPPHDAAITGWVRDAGGAALAGARVRAAPSEYYSTTPSVVAISGPDGRFALAGVDRVAYDLTVELAQHLPAVREKVLGGSRDVELTLDSGLPIAGRVVDAHGDPVASYQLIVQRQDGLSRAHVTALSVIDPQGRFEVRVASGNYDLIASARDHGRATVQAAAGTGDVRLALGSGPVVRGRVIARDGSPIADAFVAVQAVPGSRSSPSVVPVTTTDADGTFELEALSPGPVALRIGASGYITEIVDLPAAGKDGVRGPIAITLASGGPERMRGERVIGIGVEILPEADAVRIVRVLRDSGAGEAGLSEGDLIIAVNGVPVATLGAFAAVGHIRGPAGTSVTLTVRRNGRDEQRVVERREVRS